MKINYYHGGRNVTRRSRKIKYIVVHYVGAGTSAPGSALANCKYFAAGDRNSSANYFIDDSGIWEYANPSDFAAWHCGDGKGKYGITNANSIGIEVCISGDKPYTEKEIGYLAELVRHLMSKYKIPASNVVRHYDASRKQCPLYYVKRPSEWENLHSRITNNVIHKNNNGFPYMVKVVVDELNVRSGTGLTYKVVTKVKKNDVYTIVDEKKVNGITWGKLRSGVGWISLKYTERI